MKSVVYMCRSVDVREARDCNNYCPQSGLRFQVKERGVDEGGGKARGGGGGDGGAGKPVRTATRQTLSHTFSVQQSECTL